MADEKLTLEVDFGRALSNLGTFSSAVGGIGAGGGIGGIGSAIGAASRLGAFTSALSAAATAIGALATATRSAIDSLRGFGQLRQTLGSTSGETAMLQVLGGALGISDMRRFAERIRQAGSSGFGAMELAKMGLGPQLDIDKPVNLGRLTLQVIDYIRAATTEEEALLRARKLGVEEAVEFWGMSKDAFAKMRQEAREIERTFSRDRVNSAREFNQEMDRFGRSIDRLKVSLGAPFIKVGNALLDDFQWGDLLPGGEIRRAKRLRSRANDAASGNKPLDDNTAAQNRNTQALERMIGVWGGGRRARGAIPGAFGPGNGAALSEAVRAGTIRLGPYAVSL